jgi:hypothetical protein
MMTVMTENEMETLEEPRPAEIEDELMPPAQTGEYRSPGSIKFGPFVITARFSIILIFIIVIGFNLLLFLGVILAALYRAGRL